MPDDTNEISLAGARAQLADVVHAASTRGQITYLTNRGRRVAAIVSVPQAEAIENAASSDHNEHL